MTISCVNKTVPVHTINEREQQIGSELNGTKAGSDGNDIGIWERRFVVCIWVNESSEIKSEKETKNSN